MKTQVTLTQESADFLRELANKMKTQDNRCTAKPYFYTVRSLKDVAVPDGDGDGVSYFDNTGCCSMTEQEMKDYCRERGEDFDDYVAKHCVRYGTKEDYEDENVFLTEAGYEQHMELNGHNYRHLKRSFSYLHHAFRNPEMESLWKALLEFAEEGDT